MIETFDALDAGAYAELLAPEFRFVPPPGDDEIPFTELLRDRDVASTANMFANVQWAELLIQHEGAVPSEHPEFPAEDGFVMIEASRVDVRVLTREIIQGDPLLYLTGGDPMTFVFRALEDTDPPEYVLVQLEEFALISAPATEEINWGRIKALYLPAE